MMPGALDRPTAAVKALPPPLVTFSDDWRQYAKNKVVLLAGAIVLAYVGTLMVAATYYLVFELNPTINHWWHTAIPDRSLRHSVRDVGEGLLGGLLAQHIVRNRYRRLNKPAKRLNGLDKLKIRLHIANVKDNKRLSFGQLLAAPLLVLVYGSVGFVCAQLLIAEIRHNGPVHDTLRQTFAWLQPLGPSPGSGHGLSYEQRIRDSLSGAWPNKLAGYAAAFVFGRRPAKGVMDDTQLWLCEQRVLRYQQGAGRMPWYSKICPSFLQRRIKPMSVNSAAPWYYPPTWKATFHDVRSSGVPDGVYHPFLSVELIPLLLLAGACLAGFGFYVLTVIAAG